MEEEKERDQVNAERVKLVEGVMESEMGGGVEWEGVVFGSFVFAVDVDVDVEVGDP
jgi:hypothetical protein